MTTIYNVDKFVKGVNGFGLPFCQQVYTVTLNAGQQADVDVPESTGLGLPGGTVNNKFIAVFSYSTPNVWVAINGNANVPAGANFAAAISELCPSAKYCLAGDAINIISAGTPSVSVAFYALVD
jgi:hypothetical protein